MSISHSDAPVEIPHRQARRSARNPIKAKIFIAWSEETRSAAELIRRHLADAQLSAWLSDQIEWGAPFRGRIRDAIRGADLVVAVFPQEPSRWQIAEAGLAYFEQKLLPVIIDTGEGRIAVVEPFAELQAHKLARSDIERERGETLSALVNSVKEKLGEGSTSDWFVRGCRVANKLFVGGVPIVGAAIVCSLLVAALVGSDQTRDLELWKAGHTVFGAIVFGGGSFVALVLARAGISTSFSERQFGFRVGRQLFYLWLSVALAQFAIGLALLFVSPFSYQDPWVFIAMLGYLFAIGFWYGAYDRYRASNLADRDGEALRVSITLSFVGNFLFSVGLLLLTLVIVLMSLKHTGFISSLLGIENALRAPFQGP